MSFGELLDRTFTNYRRHFWLFVGIMALPQALIITLSVISQGAQARLMPIQGGNGAALPGAGYFVAFIGGSIVAMLAYFVLYSVALGATTFAVSEIHMGRPFTARAAYRRVRGCFWRLLDLIVTVGVRAILAFFLVGMGTFVPVGLMGAFAGSLGGATAALLGIITLVGVLGGMVLVLWFFLRYGCSVPALLLENLKARAAIKRSVTLTKGNVGRVFLITVLMSLVSYAVALVLEGPFLVVFFWKTIKRHGQPPPFWITLGLNVSGGLGHALTGPLLMIGLVLLYYDIRVRKEGFDLQIMMTALDKEAPLAAAAPAPRPATGPALQKKNVAPLVALTILTLGLYYPIWFLQGRSGVNSLKAGGKLGRGVFVLVFVLWFLALVLNAVWTTSDDLSARLSPIWLLAFDALAALVVGVLLLIQAFKVRRILETHVAGSASGPFAGSIALLGSSSFSGLATFFFGIFYLQHKINEMADVGQQSPPALETDVLPAI
ncbi:MAG: hypothetical protein DMG21_11775 [Acidobacteria bacterium]|nr:MAG: hypothetical protein DMG21_11775 [Acidobacteriota bacterium]